MTSAASPSAQQTSASASANSGSTTPQSGAVPAQLPVRSYANATKTASSTPPAAAGASASNAKSSESPVNGTGPTAQGGSQPAPNGVSSGAPSSEHGRKPSMVISATGSSGYTQNGGPVGQTGRPPINFGSMNAEGAQSSAAQQSQAASAPAQQEGQRVIEPEHSPSPIPQPTASGGRPPSIAQGNGLNFGSMGGDASQNQASLNAAGQPTHERRASSQSAYSDMGGPRGNFVPQAGRGRGYPSAQYNNMGSPAQGHRQMANQPRAPGMAQQFSQGPQGAPYNRGRNSPAQPPAQPMPPMQYQGYPQHLGAQPPMYPGMPNSFDPYAGHYNPYPPYNYQYPNQGPPQSPRPQYPNAFSGTPGSNQPPFMPPSMARTSSQASDRPSSSVGHAATPSQSHAQTAPVPAPQTPQPSTSFVRPVKKSSAIKITNDKGEAVSFQKPSPSPSTQQPQTPVIVSTPNAPTPPPRAPSTQHTRTESTSTMTAQEKQNAFKEQVKRQMEENKRKAEAESQAKDAPESAPAADATASKPAAETEVKAAVAETEKAAAVAASDKAGEKDAAAAATAVEDDEAEKKRKEKEEEDRIEREIAEMEAAEKAEEEREKAYQAKKKAEKEAAAKANAAKLDEDLKRQEREAEERELQRERERNGESKKEEGDEESKALFASLKKPNLGPGASEQSSGSQTPAPAEAQPVANAAQAAQKPKPAHLKLETTKRVEPAEPTPGMQALKSSRFLEVKEDLKYPEGIKSPNPALNQNGTQKGRAYDKDFLLQFQNVFKEKPTVDWDQKVKDTLGGGDEPGSARPGSARTPSNMGQRQASGRGGSNFGGAMGSFGSVPGGRTLPSGTTSEQRFALANAGGRPMGAPGSMGGRQPSNLGMGAPGMSRNSSMMGPGSPRQPSGRGKGGASRRGDRAPSKKEMDDAASKMPLTAGMELKPIEKTANGWVARSLTQPAGAAADPSGNMAPDMVQRKVKAALNKMTPEKFDRISDQILEIAAQSKNEADGRTLRQVIQLTFEKACDEAHWAGMYAKFCHKMLTTMSLEIRDETIKDKSGNPVVGGALFRKYLLNRCQEEFERGWEANLPDKPEGEETAEIKLMSDEYYVAAAAKRRGLGLIQFIGQLYKLGMLTIRIMHECVQRLLNFEGDPDESAIENLTTLLRSVGPTMFESGEQGQALLNAYFERINEKIMSNAALPSRPRFMVMDLIDLKNAGWKGKDDAKGPKTIQQIHAEAEAAQAKAEAERQRQRAPGGRPMGGRGDSRNFSGNMPPPVDYSRTHVGADELRRLQNRTQSRNTGGGLGPGGNLGPGGGLGGRAGSRRGNLGPTGSGNTTRTNTPPVDNKKDEPTAQQNAFSALAALNADEEDKDHAANETASPPAAQSSGEGAQS